MTYLTYRNYLKERFGGPVLKVPLRAGFSCPNRDGTLGRQGCTFCDNRAFSPALAHSREAVEELKRIIARAQGKYRGFLPYLQPFSNTYGDVETLKRVYEPLVAQNGVVGLALGTRPDCFAAGVMEYLQELNSRTYVVVELGLQSGNNATLQRLARGHTVEQFAETVLELERRRIYTVAHCMLGLPGESETDMLAMARFLASLPVHGVKFHQTMVIQGTALEQEYRGGRYVPLELGEYAGLVARCVGELRPDQHIHRLCAQSTVETGLVAPLWSAERVESLAAIRMSIAEL